MVEVDFDQNGLSLKGQESSDQLFLLLIFLSPKNVLFI